MSETSELVFERIFTNNLNDLERVTDEALAFAEQFEISAAAGYRVRLSIEEMATNILKYAYNDAAPHTIRLRLEMEPDHVNLLLEDDGQPFDPLETVEPNTALPLEERSIGGLGIHLIRKFASKMQYERRNDRNRLSIWINRTAAA
jgi:anti-sigma regulatory factor (Ser/Thr protein kinase)